MGNLESQEHAMKCAICTEVGSCKVRREIEAEEEIKRDAAEIVEFAYGLVDKCKVHSVICDSTNNTPETIAKGELHMHVLKYAPSIVIDFKLPEKETK